MPVRYIPHPITAIRYQFPPGRALDPFPGAFVNVYQNLRLRPISVQITCECTQAVAANMARFIATTGVGPNPADIAAYAGYQGILGAAPKFAHFYVEFMVAPGLYYAVAADQGAGNLVNLNIWVEIWL